MFNVGGQEFLVILLVALVVLGPTRLPDALRQVGKFVGEARKLSSNFQNEVQAAMNDPVKQVTGHSLPKNAKDLVGFAVDEPFKAQAKKETDPDQDGNDDAPKADTKPSGPSFDSAAPAKAKPVEPVIEPAVIDPRNADPHEGLDSAESAASPLDDDESDDGEDDSEVPMFGDR